MSITNSKIKNWTEQFENYKKNGFTDYVLKEENWRIRLGYYNTHGYTEQALGDENFLIRINAYKALGDKYKERLLLCERYNDFIIKEVLEYWEKK